MSDQVIDPSAPAPVKAPTAEDLDLSKFFGPATDPAPQNVTGVQEVALPATDAGPPAPAQSAAATPEPAPAPEPKKPEVESEIAAALREMREERAARDHVKQEVLSWKGKYESVVSELEAVKSAPKFEDDPIAYVRARKWTPEQQTEIVQLLAYDLAPEKAPPGFMMKVMESRDAARKRLDQEAREAREAEMAKAQEAQVLHQYVMQLDAAVSTFDAGRFPANEDWYGDNRRAYVEDLYRMANVMAEEAQASGRVANLTVEYLASQMEARNASRLAEIESRRSKRKPAAQNADTRVGTVQSAGSPASTNGLRQSGGPRPPALTEEERVKRAIEAAFPSR